MQPLINNRNFTETSWLNLQFSLLHLGYFSNQGKKVCTQVSDLFKVHPLAVKPSQFLPLLYLVSIHYFDYFFSFFPINLSAMLLFWQKITMSPFVCVCVWTHVYMRGLCVWRERGKQTRGHRCYKCFPLSIIVMLWKIFKPCYNNNK